MTKEKETETTLILSALQLVDPLKDFLHGQVGILIMKWLDASCELITG